MSTTADNVTVVPGRRRHVGPEEPTSLDGWRVRIDGLVSRPAALSTADLAHLGASCVLRSAVTCPDGAIGTADADYTGVALDELIERAEPLPAA